MTPLFILSAFVFLAALGAVLKARPVHAALFLALSLALMAVLFLTVGADFIGLIQFTVYVGAVAVLIVFSLLITRPGDEAEEIRLRPRSLAIGLGCMLPAAAVLIHAALFGSNLKPVPWNPAVPLKELGQLLFTSHAPAVIAIGILLTAVMIGAALFARDPGTLPQDSSEK